MESYSCINELEDSVLGYICDMVDSLSIVELLRVGNRLLTLKLCSPYGISRYCDVGEYGSYIGPLEWILPQLKGLKTVSITSNKMAIVGGLLAYLIPSTVTSIELYGQDIIDACFEERDGKEYFLGFSSRFPALQSLSLFENKEPSSHCGDDSDIESGDDEDQHDFQAGTRCIPLFPPSLTRLCINFWYTSIESTPFPTTLEHLEIECEKLGSLSWIFTLPLLRTLKILKFRKVAPVDESFENLLHPTLTTLHFSIQGYGDKTNELVALLRRLGSLFPTLPHLQHFGLIPTEIDEFDAASYNIAWGTSLNRLAKIKSLYCPYDENLTLPQTLVELRWLPTMSDRVWIVLGREEVIRLPPSLTILYAPIQELNMHDFELLPRTLTSLTISGLPPGCPCSALPPLLTRLDIDSLCDWYLLNDLSKCLPNLSTVSGPCNELFVTTTKNLSESQTGWTNLMYAACMEDFDALHRLVVEYMKIPYLTEKEKFDLIWSTAHKNPTVVSNTRAKKTKKIQLPSASANWFRLRGLCSYPRRLGKA